MMTFKFFLVSLMSWCLVLTSSAETVKYVSDWQKIVEEYNSTIANTPDYLKAMEKMDFKGVAELKSFIKTHSEGTAKAPKITYENSVVWIGEGKKRVQFHEGKKGQFWLTHEGQKALFTRGETLEAWDKKIRVLLKEEGVVSLIDAFISPAHATNLVLLVGAVMGLWVLLKMDEKNEERFDEERRRELIKDEMVEIERHVGRIAEQCEGFQGQAVISDEHEMWILKENFSKLKSFKAKYGKELKTNKKFSVAFECMQRLMDTQNGVNSTQRGLVKPSEGGSPKASQGGGTVIKK